MTGATAAGTNRTRPLRAAVIGAGMSGILSAVKLLEADIECRVFEKGERVGGTWRDNTYPGLACDVAAHWYTYSFQRNPEWDRLMAPGPELQRYFEGVAEARGVTARTRFGDAVARVEYADGSWRVTTDSGYSEVFDLVIAATGILHHPNIPRFEGIETFAGDWFHSSQWRHDVPVDGRRVGVIGTGSTAAQITVALVDRVADFRLFQRTAQWVLPRPNTSYTEEDKARFRADPAALEALVQELRVKTVEGYATAVLDFDSPELAAIEQLCRDNLATVRDPELRRRLTPDYRAACKRLVISSDFYDAIQHPNATLVDQPIERVEANGIRTADGALHELDVLVLATGFRVDRFIRPSKVIGRGGVDLDDLWVDGPEAYLSITMPDFPNFFFVNGPNSPVGNFSAIETAERQIGYIMQLVEGLQAERYREASASHAALRQFEEARREAAKRTVWATGCNSWYLNDKGVPMSWTWSYDRFIQETEAPRLEDFDLR